MWVGCQNLPAAPERRTVCSRWVGTGGVPWHPVSFVRAWAACQTLYYRRPGPSRPQLRGVAQPTWTGALPWGSVLTPSGLCAMLPATGFPTDQRDGDKEFVIRRAATNRVLNVLRHWVSKHSQVGGGWGALGPAGTDPGTRWGRESRTGVRVAVGLTPLATVSEGSAQTPGGDQGHSRGQKPLSRHLPSAGLKVGLPSHGPTSQVQPTGTGPGLAQCLLPEGLQASLVAPPRASEQERRGSPHGQNQKL